MQTATEAVIRALNAKRAIWDAKAQKHELVDDHQVQMKAAELIWAYEEGLPIKRQEIITGQMDSQETLERTARKSPALLSSLEKLVDKIQREQATAASQEDPGQSETATLSTKRRRAGRSPVIDAEEANEF